MKTAKADFAIFGQKQNRIFGLLNELQRTSRGQGLSED